MCFHFLNVYVLSDSFFTNYINDTHCCWCPQLRSCLWGPLLDPSPFRQWSWGSEKTLRHPCRRSAWLDGGGGRSHGGTTRCLRFHLSAVTPQPQPLIDTSARRILKGALLFFYGSNFTRNYCSLSAVTTAPRGVIHINTPITAITLFKVFLCFLPTGFIEYMDVWILFNIVKKKCFSSNIVLRFIASPS